MHRGKHIIIDGPAGSGKRTQLEALRVRLQDAGFQVAAFEPAGHAIRQDMQPVLGQGTIYLSRGSHLAQSIANRHTKDEVVSISGRPDSGDIWIILDAPANILVERIASADPTRHVDIANLERSRATYLWEASRRKLSVVDANQPFDVVADTIWQLVSGGLDSSMLASVDHLKYLVPAGLDNEATEQYHTYIGQILTLHEQILSRLSGIPNAVSIAANVLPLAATLHGDKGSNRSSTSSVAQTAANEMPMQYATVTDQPVQLVGVWPRNELDSLPAIIYPAAQESYETITQTVAGWSYDHKSQIFQNYLAVSASDWTALQSVVYSWDIVSDYGIYRELAAQCSPRAVEAQEITPRFGFDTPDEIEVNGLTDEYEDCFDLSLRLHSMLQQTGARSEADLAVLTGNRLRWKLRLSARGLATLASYADAQTATSSAQTLVRQLVITVSEQHPLMASILQKNISET